MAASSAGPAPGMTVRDLASAYRAGSLLPSTATKEFLRRADAQNQRLNCFITLLGESALKEAEAADRRHRAGKPLGPLDGVPIAVKDIIYIEGVRCTAGSRILAGNIAPYDATVVRKLKEAGAVIIGTTNLHEFAAGITCDNPHYGAARNPWDLERDAGGSSGGSAVAVASGLSAAALGTDTAGSVRVPAALCGILGFKPTYGRVSRLGVIPLASSLDTVGILASSAWDAAAMLQTMAGHDADDITTVDTSLPDLTDALSHPVNGIRVGLVRKYFLDKVDSGAEESLRSFVSRLEGIGCTVGEAELDGVEDVYGEWLPIRKAEATAFHLRWLNSSPELYGEDVRKLLEQGKDVPAVDYVKALNARPSFMERFSSSMKNFDFLAVPCTCIPAPKIGQASVSLKGKEVDVRSALLRLTVPFNYVGFPAISVPSTQVGSLPFGVQVVGRLFDEAGLLRLVNALEARFGPYPTPKIQEQRPATP